MLYVLAIFLPPVALLLAGKPFQAIFNFLLWITIVGAFFAMIWGILVIANHYADQRTDRLIREMQASQAAAVRAASPARTAKPGRPAIIDDLEAQAAHQAAQRAIAQRRRERVEALERAREAIWETLRLAPGRLVGWLAASYRNLPEWAQPILWGLAVAAPFLAGVGIYVFTNRFEAGVDAEPGDAVAVADQERSADDVAPGAFAVQEEADPRPAFNESADRPPIGEADPPPPVNAEDELRAEVEALGLTETERVRVFRDIVQAEDRAMWESNRIFDPVNQWQERLDWEKQKMKEYRAEALKSHGLTEDEGKVISKEAFVAGFQGEWKPPDYPGTDPVEAARRLGTYVHVNPGETVYHRKGCLLLHANSVRVPLAKAIREGRDCKGCLP